MKLNQRTKRYQWNCGTSEAAATATKRESSRNVATERVVEIAGAATKRLKSPSPNKKLEIKQKYCILSELEKNQEAIKNEYTESESRKRK